MKEDVPAWEVRATGSGLAVWRICFERRLEPRAAELPRNDGPIAGEESVQRPAVEYARRQGRGKVACDHVCGYWLDRQFDGDNSPLFHRYVVSVWASWRPRLQLRVAIDRSGTGGRATMFSAGLFRAPVFPHYSRIIFSIIHAVQYARCVRPLWISVLHAVHATGPRLRQFHHQERWRLRWKTCSPS